MSDRPIPFSAPMVRAVLREIEQPGTGKTQTRRVAKFVTEHRGGLFHIHNAHGGVIGASDANVIAYGPDYAPYQVGDRLWVRESWKAHSTFENVKPRDIPPSRIFYLSDQGYSPSGSRGRPSMFMPRWASRLTLIVTDVRVERLQDISEEDAIAEGVEYDSDGWRDYLMPATQCGASAKDSYRTLWDSINGEKHPWSSNPWIVAVTFRPILGNIDLIGSAS